MATHQFETEVNQLLTLIIHSLYSNKEIFLREIVSNASDALDKLKYLTISDEKYKSVAFEPRIDISFDEDGKILVIKDSGIGMNETDFKENLGTIARSGTKAFLQKLEADAKKNSALIGQFGVGFYSAFMVAKKIDVISHKAAEDKIFKWTSDGSSGYDLEEVGADNEDVKKHGLETGCGTAVILYLNDDDAGFASRWQIEGLIKKYSDHIAFPIYLHYVQKNYDDKGNVTGEESKVEKINSASALWQRPKSEIKPEDYNEFYKTLSHDGSDPLLHIHTHAEGTQEYTTLFYIPQTAPFDLYHADYKSGVKLYVKRVFITDDDRELLPSYLRFVRGIIDSEDLPLNVSREILQQNRILSSIKSASVRKILSEIANLGERAEKDGADEKDKEAWKTFLTNFNRPMKEGLYGDYANRDELLNIVRFKSTACEKGEFCSIADYVDRMKADQKAIYYITGNDEAQLRASPLLEVYKKDGFEILIMDDEIDDIVVSSLGKYKDYEIKAVNRAGSDDELSSAKDSDEKAAEEAKPIVEKIKAGLGEAVKDVRSSKRLTDSPACVVVDENDPSMQFERMMRAMGQEGISEIKPILEINCRHPLVEKVKDADEATTADIAHILLDQSILLDGGEIKDPNDFVQRLNRLLSK
ncbi:MAG: molecular chaperone HtpG [Spirochaetaceae bacterium]|nr:molecular chaperone HtpG [Spirochaetaceae bacterium]